MKRTANRLLVVKNQAKREGWLKWVRNPSDEIAMMRHGCRFNERRADVVVDFYSDFMRLSKGERFGEPFELLPFQRDEIIKPMMGWEMPDGRRRFREAYISKPKKNGKSSLMSGLANYMAFADNEPAAEVYCIANSKEQAGLVFNDVKFSVESSPELSAALKIFESSWTISDEATLSFIKALPGVPRLTEGVNGYCLIIDEFHAFVGRKLWAAIRYMMSSRKEPLMAIITTAGDDVGSVCYEQYDYTKQVLSGKIPDPHRFGAIWEADENDPPAAVATLKKANPGYGVTLDAEQLKAAAAQALRNPADLAEFKRYKLNMWVSAGASLLADGIWKQCADEDFDETLLLDRACYGGLDLAKIYDTTAFALAFEPTSDDPVVRLKVWFWLPEESAKKLTTEHGDIVPWKHWANEGAVKLTEGDVCDYGIVEADMLQIGARYQLIDFAFDPYQAEAFTQRLETHFGMPRFEFRQTRANYAEPIEEFKRLCLLAELKHDDNPVMNWQVGNAVIKKGLIQKPEKNDYRKIDGVQAAVMALGRWLKNADEGGGAYAPNGDDESSDVSPVILF